MLRRRVVQLLAQGARDSGCASTSAAAREAAAAAKTGSYASWQQARLQWVDSRCARPSVHSSSGGHTARLTTLQFIYH